MYCKHCGNKVVTSEHYCSKKGLLKVDEDDSFLTSALIGGIVGSVTDSSILGGIAGSLLGGDSTGGFLGGIAGDLFDGDLFD